MFDEIFLKTSSEINFLLRHEAKKNSNIHKEKKSQQSRV